MRLLLVSILAFVSVGTLGQNGILNGLGIPANKLESNILAQEGSFRAYTGASVPAPYCTTISSACGKLVLGYSYYLRSNATCDSIPYLSQTAGFLYITGIAPPGTSSPQANACIYSVPGNSNLTVQLNGGITSSCSLTTEGGDPFSCTSFYIPPVDTSPDPDNPPNLAEEFYNILSASDLQIDAEVTLDLETIISVGDIFVPIMRKVKLIILRPEAVLYRPPVGTDCQSNSPTVMRLFAPSQGGSGICVETSDTSVLGDIFTPTVILCDPNKQCAYLDFALEGEDAENLYDKIVEKFDLYLNPYCVTEEQATKEFNDVRTNYPDLGEEAVLDLNILPSMAAHFSRYSGMTFRGPLPRGTDFVFFDVHIALDRFSCMDHTFLEQTLFHESIHADHLLIKNLTVTAINELAEEGVIVDDHDIIETLEDQYYQYFYYNTGDRPNLCDLPWRVETNTGGCSISN